MIRVDTAAALDRLMPRLSAKARAIAAAGAETSTLAAQGDPRRWRTARLLWPLFTQG